MLLLLSKLPIHIIYTVNSSRKVVSYWFPHFFPQSRGNDFSWLFYLFFSILLNIFCVATSSVFNFRIIYWLFIVKHKDLSSTPGTRSSHPHFVSHVFPYPSKCKEKKEVLSPNYPGDRNMGFTTLLSSFFGVKF